MSGPADAPEEPAADSLALEEKALSLVTAYPERFTKTALAKEMGGKRKEALAAATRLLLTGRIGPNRRGAVLHVFGEGTQDDG